MADDERTTEVLPARIRLPQAADYIGCKKATLASARWREMRGVPFARLSPRGPLVFDRAELDAWLAGNRQREATA